ncbi:DUF5666 domain-containing protein [Idiomarina seosinensis]|uniref:DUF5666 domain-containing protein n=1 Tax=Idiomarina seosinensis TaxID=281739 RepID=A0A432ZG31_9GAMM|nr:DUF5666 domain-containing protein [Idiomarina seosinensis]RUO76937.1 hypothetical protein CWI81_00045 [Idiomarina seosinensis]
MRFSKSLIALALSTSLTACGGSDSSEPTGSNPPATGGGGDSGSSVYSEGVITGFGSVYVNGQRYRSGNANIAVGNNPAAEEADLKVGMVVSVAASSAGDGEDPEASDIRYEEHLQGAVTFIDTEQETLDVLGQQVVFNDLTEFDGTELSTLAVGDIVEVSGYINDDGDFYATRIELETDADEFNIKGTISSLDTDAQTFAINALTINYSGAEFDDMSADDLADGLYVKVEGENFDEETTTLTATTIENKEQNLDDIDDVDEIKIAGIVSDYNEAEGVFTVNRYTFNVNDETEFEDGPASRLANGVRVKVEAEVENEQLFAEEIEFIAKDARQKTEGQVESVDTDNQTFVINGITFTVEDDTTYLDTSGQGARQFNFADIAVNDWLKVLSVIDDNGDTVAVKVKRSDEDDRDGEVKGVASGVTVDGMTVAGVSIVFNEETEFEGDDDNNDGNLSVDEFVALFDGEEEIEVEVKGNYDGDILIAQEVEIETDDDDDGDDDQGDKTGKAEFEGAVESIDGETLVVNGIELRFDDSSELEVDDQEVSVADFIAAIEVGTVIEIEGVWREQSYVQVLEAEVE